MTDPRKFRIYEGMNSRQKNEVADMYLKKEKTNKEIMEWFNLSKSTFRDILLEKGVLQPTNRKSGITISIPSKPTAQEIEHISMIASLQINGIFTAKHLDTTLNAVRYLLKAFQEDSHYLFNPSISQEKEITSLFKDTKLTKENDAKLEANYQRAIKNGRPIKDMTPTNVNKV